jgi:CubicO group peptidase (beta-lactamase class C family)
MLSPRLGRLIVANLAPLLLVLAAAAAQAQPPSRARAAAVIDSLARAPVDARQVAGLAVAVMKGRDTVLARAYGKADVENDVPTTVRHVFQIASVTKEFTAAAVLKLAEEGKLGLDDDVTRYLPEAPTQGRKVTIRQLLSHTSGIADVAELPSFRGIKRRDLPPDSVLALVRSEPFYFPPGEQMRYSNSGYLLLGQLIEKVSGRPYADFLAETLFRPAGMTDSRYCDQRALIPRRVRGYDFTPTGFLPAEFISLRIPFAAGGLCSTALDLVAWSQALNEGRVLGPAAYAEMTRAQVVGGGRRTRYGLGLGVGTIAGRRVYHHGGDIDGFTSYLAYFPDDSLSVAVVMNTQGPSRPDALVERIAEAVLGQARPAPHVASPANLSRFVGEYGGDVKVSETERGLRLVRGPLPPVDLRPAGGTTFTDGRALYTFEPNAGAATTLWADLTWALVRWDRRREGRP